MLYKAVIILSILSFQALASLDPQISSVTQELSLSSNDSSSTMQEVVSINDNWAFVGTENDNVYGASSGSVHVFKNVNGNWIKHTKIIPHDGLSTE